ncbi:MAG: aminotransferase class V-fold PLP-dependent enzyme [Fimbriimonadaceae bacterium]|nr:aminotransferase class V-fold PLP-dependent enzyme [Fimbriimonadaceae bacterium]
MTPDIGSAIAALGPGPIEQGAIRKHIDPLFHKVLARERQQGLTYLANHSLGRPLDQTACDIAEASTLWYESMDEAWVAWLDEQGRFRSRIARLIGVSRDDAVVPKTSAGQGLRAVLNSFPQNRPVRVVTTTGEFDSIDFILKTYAIQGRATVDFVDPSLNDGPVPLFEAGAIAERVEKGCDLLVVSQVYFTTGQILRGLEELVKHAQSRGSQVLVDAYHSAGVIPVDFDRHGFDFAIGGCYKYLRGGPGAGFLAIHPRHLDTAKRTLDTGWFAKKDTFSYLRPDHPELSEGGDAWLESTPPILTVYQARAGLEFTLAIGTERLRNHSLETLAKLRAACPEIHVPTRPEEGGAFALWPVSNADEAVRRLRTMGVKTDSRGGFVRLCPDILTTDEDIAKAARAIQSVNTEPARRR